MYTLMAVPFCAINIHELRTHPIYWKNKRNNMNIKCVFTSVDQAAKVYVTVRMNGKENEPSRTEPNQILIHINSQ